MSSDGMGGLDDACNACASPASSLTIHPSPSPVSVSVDPLLHIADDLKTAAPELDANQTETTECSLVCVSTALGADTMDICGVPAEAQLSQTVVLHQEYASSSKFQNIIPSREWRPTDYILAQHDGAQRLFDLYNIAYGVQWELARLASHGKFTWDQLGEHDVAPIHIKRVAGTCADIAPNIATILSSRFGIPPQTTPAADRAMHPALVRERSQCSHWAELDAEEKALIARKGEGLGGLASSDVYHGKVHFTALVVWKNGRATVRLEPPKIDESTRFARQFGSRRFIRLRNIFQDHKTTKATLMTFFMKRFIFMGRIYQAFLEKDETVHLVETNEQYKGRKPNLLQGDQLRKSFMSFVTWHNPLKLNTKQNMIKWANRFALGLSTTVPALRIEPENIHFINDRLSDAHIGPGKPESHHQLTDGCGYINGTAMKMMADRLGLKATPSAVQARFAGAKGMFIIHPRHDFAGPPAIWIRESQRKIKYRDMKRYKPDQAMCILDVVKIARLHSPARLSAEIISVLADRGVPASVFIRYLEEHLKEEIDGLFDFENASALHLWLKISKEGAVVGARLGRAIGAGAKARGFEHRQEEDDFLDDDDLLDVARDRSASWSRDPVSGCPSTLEESAMTVIDSGFTLADSSYLRRKVKRILTQKLKSIVSKQKLVVPGSADALVVPSPYVSALKPGQVSLRLSHPITDPQTGMQKTVITGPVLLVRHPCKIPSDIQLAEAVDCPALDFLTDVLVTSIDPSQSRSMPSMLAGGDCDGDSVCVFWDATLIKHFQVASTGFLEPPAPTAAFFRHHTGSVAEFLRLRPSLTRRQHEGAIQACLLSSLHKDEPGIWSNYHLQASYLYGVSSPQATHLAFMFCNVLDGAKSGLRVNEDKDQDFRAFFGRLSMPNWKLQEAEESTSDPRHQSKVPLVLQPEYVMEQLASAARKLCDQRKEDFDKKCEQMNGCMDQDLAKPYLDLLNLDRRILDTDLRYQIKNELKLVEAHVRKLHKKCCAALRPRTMLRNGTARQSFSSKSIGTRQDILRALSTEFAAGPPAKDVPILSSLKRLESVRASTAYVLDYKNDSFLRKPPSDMGTDFPFNMAMRELCAIKAEANKGGYKTMVEGIYDVMAPHHRAGKLIEQQALRGV